jgi:hypothetical protein
LHFYLFEDTMGKEDLWWWLHLHSLCKREWVATGRLFNSGNMVWFFHCTSKSPDPLIQRYTEG